MPLIIAGGLNSGNVAQAIEMFQPWGVDVVSGVESEPGTKDETKLREFMSRSTATSDRAIKGTMEETGSTQSNFVGERPPADGEAPKRAHCPDASARTAAATFPRR